MRAWNNDILTTGREMMKKSFLVVSILLSTLCAFADENVLQTIQIDPIKDTYNIVLISDKAVDVKKDVEEDGSILLSMKGIRASEMLNTVFNGTSNIDSVIVTPKSKDELEVRIKGDNVERSTVTFDSLTPPVNLQKQNAKQEIVLSKPMKTYDPIFTPEEEQEYASATLPPIGQKIVDMIKSIYGNSTNRGIINFGLLGLILFAAIKLIRTKETEEIKVGLAQSLAEREINMYKPMQKPITNNFTSTTEKPYTTLNYGLNAYRNVNKNPYETRKPVVSPVKTVPSQAKKQSSTMTIPTEQIVTKTHTQSSENRTNIDNLKFLETMSAIYEKSGRHDLAQGIKANLSKVK